MQRTMIASKADAKTYPNKKISALFALALLLAGCATTSQNDQDSLALTMSPSLKNPNAQAFSYPNKNAPLTVDFGEDGTSNLALIGESEDIFERIRQGFGMNNIDNELVLAHQQRYMKQPEYLRRIFERSGRYLFHIVSEIDRRKMPMELALLPMVESAFNPKAFSSAKASGLWQFIPSTGKRFNLNQNWWKDERRDVVASTGAALEYLQTIYEMHGDWHLALASYNWGEGSVLRAVNKNRAKDLPTDYLSLTMPAETRNYVPKLQALKNIISNPALVAELRLPRVPNKPYFGTLIASDNMDVSVAARLADISVDEFVALNPAHNRPIITANSPLVIPTLKLETFRNNLEDYAKRREPLSAWQTYTVKSGERFEQIAPRFGMSVANLKAINDLRGKAQAFAGQTLLVPGAGEIHLNAMINQPFDNERETSEKRTYIVKKGDTLNSIAKKNKISVATLKKLNKLAKNNSVKSGDRLTIALIASKPAKKETNKEAGKSTAKLDQKTDKSTSKTANAKNNPPKVRRYTVKKGDTLSAIAKNHEVSIGDIRKWNKLSSDKLALGHTLNIH